MKKFAFLLLITAVVTYGQTPAPPKPKSDAEKIASAMGAGPKFVTQNATVLDWPSLAQAATSGSPASNQRVDVSSGFSSSRPR